MFSNKKNINILTSLLVAHGVKRAVVCPGSRNAPIVHNLNECQDIECHPVTDERSAGFYALGMALADDYPVAVCVTSGSALLNLAPAVAEASYLHHGIIVISADRPSAWIDQLDGQTLPQPGALGCFVGRCVTLPEPRNDEECWYCNRLVNEALTAVRTHGRKSVHINVPISEPLFDFTIDRLPAERKIEILPSIFDKGTFKHAILPRLFNAMRPMVVIGQTQKQGVNVEKALHIISSRFTVLAEPLSSPSSTPFDLALLPIAESHDNYKPDFILYLGDTLVSKRLKAFIRGCGGIETWAVSEDGDIHDTFMNLTGVIEGDAMTAITLLAEEVESPSVENRYGNAVGLATDFMNRWNVLLTSVDSRITDFEPPYSQLAAIKEFEMSLEDMDYDYHVHYANSTAVRLANIYSRHYVWCNRGVNGIEGCLSTASGFSIAVTGFVFCVIGDLSFFYDQNSLWNSDICGNLRVILLNNGGGGIFYGLPGLKRSPACDKLVAARHDTTAQGICTQNDVGYLSARDMDELRIGLATLMTSGSNRPMLLEIFTDSEQDEAAMRGLMESIQNGTIY